MKSVLVPILMVVVIYGTSIAQLPNVKNAAFGKAKPKPLFAFIHLTDTHIGEGAQGGDYGTQGYFDTLNGSEWGYPAARLSNAVKWINENTMQKRIAFVIVSGDLTDSGEKSEFMHFKKMMDSLAAPYFPLMGNHDAWPYNRFGDEAPKACGDSLMNLVFEPTFKQLNEYYVLRSDSRNQAWWCDEANTTAYLQNFHYSFKGYSFIFLDFNPRYHVRKNEPGIGPEAQLMPGKGGTLDFLTQALARADSLNEKVFLISHHPPIASLLGRTHAFNNKEKIALAKAIHPHRKIVLAWFAGHIHRNATYRFTKAKGLKVIETRANKSQEFGGFRLMTVY